MVVKGEDIQKQIFSLCTHKYLGLRNNRAYSIQYESDDIPCHGGGGGGGDVYHGFTEYQNA